MPAAARRLGAASGCGRDRLLPLDRLEGAQAGRDLAAAATAREPANRYEWPCPGDLLHMDTSEYARFQRPGHRVTGDRSSQDRQHRDGVDYRARDRRRPLAARLRRDPSRSDAPPPSPASSSARSLFYADHGITAKRLMTDNAWIYVKSRDVRQLLAATRSGTSPPSPTGHAPTAKSSASTRRWRANGPTGSSTPHTASAPPPCHTGSTTTTPRGHTAHSEATPDQPRSQPL